MHVERLCIIFHTNVFTKRLNSVVHKLGIHKDGQLCFSLLSRNTDSFLCPMQLDMSTLISHSSLLVSLLRESFVNWLHLPFTFSPGSHIELLLFLRESMLLILAQLFRRGTDILHCHFLHHCRTGVSLGWNNQDNLYSEVRIQVRVINLLNKGNCS